MKKLTQLFSIGVFVLLISACGGDETKNKSDGETETISRSEIYNEVVNSSIGDFNGVSIGMNLSEVKALFNEENKSEEAEDFLQYTISKTYTTSDFSFIFEDNKLTQLALDTEVYDSADNSDSEAAQVLFNDIQDLFLEKFGSKYLESENGNSSILFWTADDKEVQLIKDYSEVHVYIDVIEE